MTEPKSRRDFLRESALIAGAAGIGLGGRAHADAEPVADDPPLAGGPITDSHQHVWNLKQFRLPWIAPKSPMDRDFTPEDYLEAARGLNVTRSVYLEVDVVPADHVAEAEYAIGLCRRDDLPFAGAVIGGRPAAGGFAAYLDKFADAKEMKGVRQVLHSDAPPGTCVTPEFRRGIELLGERGLSFDLCMRPAEISDAARLAEACPDTQLILDHCGNADLRWAADSREMARWRADLTSVAAHPNVVCKVSGIIANAKGEPWTEKDLAPIVDHVINEFGPERVMFGGDWPVCRLGAPLADWTRALVSIVSDRTPALRRKLFHENAGRIYRLDG